MLTASPLEMTLWNGPVPALVEGRQRDDIFLDSLAFRSALISDHIICKMLGYGTKLAKKVVIWYHNSQSNDTVESSEIPQSVTEY